MLGRYRLLRRAITVARVLLLCLPLLVPFAAAQMPSPLVLLLGHHSRDYFVMHTPACVMHGVVCINVWTDHTEVSLELPQ